jgi:hypothetical protein
MRTFSQIVPKTSSTNSISGEKQRMKKLSLPVFPHSSSCAAIMLHLHDMTCLVVIKVTNASQPTKPAPDSPNKHRKSIFDTVKPPQHFQQIYMHFANPPFSIN